MIIGITGAAGSGKSTVAEAIRRVYPNTRILGFADPMKRFIREVFGVSDEMLWGPSSSRGSTIKVGNSSFTIREALQRLGTDWGRGLAPDVWVDYAVREARDLLNGISIHRVNNSSHECFGISRVDVVAIPDCRFLNEMVRLRELGCEVWKKLPGPISARGMGESHASEHDFNTKEAKDHITLEIPWFENVEDVDDYVMRALFPGKEFFMAKSKDKPKKKAKKKAKTPTVKPVGKYPTKMAL